EGKLMIYGQHGGYFTVQEVVHSTGAKRCPTDHPSGAPGFHRIILNFLSPQRAAAPGEGETSSLTEQEVRKMARKKKKVSATVQLRVRERCETKRELLLLRGSE
ncbi:Mitochondrial holo-[acyl-carrier-protein] synthase, partial [Dissostichus eleginoides]